MTLITFTSENQRVVRINNPSLSRYSYGFRSMFLFKTAKLETESLRRSPGDVTNVNHCSEGIFANANNFLSVYLSILPDGLI